MRLGSASPERLERVLDYLGLGPEDRGVDGRRINQLLDPAMAKVNSAEIYRRVPGGCLGPEPVIDLRAPAPGRAAGSARPMRHKTRVRTLVRSGEERKLLEKRDVVGIHEVTHPRIPGRYEHGEREVEHVFRQRAPGGDVPVLRNQGGSLD